jgi:hypothetical protein
MHPEGELASLSTKARASGYQVGYIAVQRPVLQADTNRTGLELLVCAGAIPDSSADVEEIRDALATMWHNVSEADLLEDKLTKRGALIYEAPCMRRIADEFYNHPKVKAVRWKQMDLIPVGVARHSDADQPTLRSESIWKKMKRLPLLMKLLIPVVLIVIGVIAIGKSIDVKKGHNPEENSQTGVSEAENLKKWTFLTSDDWNRLLQATGGKKLENKLPNLLARIDKLASAAHTTPFGKDSADSSTQKLTQEELGEIKLVNNQIAEWSKLLSEEFGLVADPGALSSAKIPRFLMAAKAPKDVNPERACVAAWFENFKNQRTDYSPALREQAEVLEDFSKAVGNQPPETMPKRIRAIWQALKDFSKTNEEELQSFRDLMGSEFKKVTDPPADYETLTVKDAQRVRLLEKILGSKEFGSVVTSGGETYGSDQSDWSKIKDRIGDGLASVERRSINDSRDVLLHALGKSFGLSKKSIAPP